MSVTLTQLQDVLTTRFGGVLQSGQHQENGRACALELLSVAQQIQWTDDPTKLRIFDLRPINDMPVEESLRTRRMLPLLVAYAESLDWPSARRKSVVTRLIILTVNRLIAALPGVSEEVRTTCRNAQTLTQAAESAGRAAGQASGRSSAEAAGMAAVVARWADKATELAAGQASEAVGLAARLAAEAAGLSRDTIFVHTCDLWMEALTPDVAHTTQAHVTVA